MFDNQYITLLNLLTLDFPVKVYISFKVREKLFLSSSAGLLNFVSKFNLLIFPFH